MPNIIRIGIGGWTYAPWRGEFYPPGLAQKRELEFASRAVTSIEINGTFYSTFKPASWRVWRDETPDDFVFAVKASRYCTNRKILAEAGPSVERFLAQGLTELGAKLGPINWQFAATKRFVAEDFEAFLSLLPRQQDGTVLRHALEVRHPSFATEAFYQLARKYRAAIVYANDNDYPTIDEATSDFYYARFMRSREDQKEGLTSVELDEVAKQTRAWSKRGEVFVYFISADKIRNPAAAMALLRKLSGAKK